MAEIFIAVDFLHTAALYKGLDFMRLFPSLEHPDFLSAQWESMYRQWCAQYKHMRTDWLGVQAAQLHANKQKHIHLLSDALSRKNYTSHPAQLRHIRLEDKWRHIYDVTLTDHLLHFIWTNILNTCLKEYITPHCHAYRKGHSIFDAIRHCATFIRQHRKKESGKVDLYVLRSDIRRYADSIPVSSASPLWPLLKDAIEQYYGEIPTYYWQLLVNLIRPEIQLEDGSLIQNITGIPFGTPLCAPLYNLYAQALDEYLGSIEGGCYCRYSDDFIFMHPDPKIFLAADAHVNDILATLFLKRNLGKEQYLYLTVAGRSHDTPAYKEKFQGTHVITLLGYNINATGTLSLKQSKFLGLIRYFRKLIGAAAASLLGASADDKANFLSQMINEHFAKMTSSKQGLKDIVLTLQNCTDRACLKQLDYEIALTIAEAATGLRGKQAFARISYHYLRHRFGLHSLCQLKNKGKL